ncbi:titin-like isoform X2 [Ochlerotatus camptorhynchus]|uniref:titin-like isoform X2 n=1 Tax=Ochlerotatus camptorhynchus TaxID=644619 RepID=UPI0031DE91CB
MPLYSELYYNYIGNAPIIPSPLSSSILTSCNYAPPSYVGVSRGFHSPIIVGRTPSFTRGYIPKLTPITETPLISARVTALTRANSSKYHPHTSPTYQKPRRVINTADIDVSASRYVRDHTPKRFLPSSPTSSASPDRNNNITSTSISTSCTTSSISSPTTTTISAREQELMDRVEQRRQRSTINRNRTVVRLNTIRARSKSRGSRGSTERKSPHRSPDPEPSFEEEMLLYKEPQAKNTSWRDQFRDELLLRPKKAEPIKSPGELLLEKHLIREDEDMPILLEQIIVSTSPVMKRRGTIRRKSAIKIPSFHEICEDINSDKLDDGLNAGELRRRASQIIEDEIAQFQQELQKANGIINDDLEERLKDALEQQIVESSVIEVPEKKKQKKIKRTRTKPLPKIDVDYKVVYDQVDANGAPIKITMDSPIIETSVPPKIMAEVELIEECTVLNLPNKKKRADGYSSPETTPKKTDQGTLSAPPLQKIEVLIIDLPEPNFVPMKPAVQEPTRKIEQTKPPAAKKPEPPEKRVLSDLAERKKTLELQKKMETLAKLTERKLPAESIPAVTTTLEYNKKTELKQTSQADAKSQPKEEIKPMEKTEEKVKELAKVALPKPFVPVPAEKAKSVAADATKTLDPTTQNKSTPKVPDPSKDPPKSVDQEALKKCTTESDSSKKAAVEVPPKPALQLKKPATEGLDSPKKVAIERPLESVPQETAKLPLKKSTGEPASSEKVVAETLMKDPSKLVPKEPSKLQIKSTVEPDSSKTVSVDKPTTDPPKSAAQEPSKLQTKKSIAEPDSSKTVATETLSMYPPKPVAQEPSKLLLKKSSTEPDSSKKDTGETLLKEPPKSVVQEPSKIQLNKSTMEPDSSKTVEAPEAPKKTEVPIPKQVPSVATLPKKQIPKQLPPVPDLPSDSSQPTTPTKILKKATDNKTQPPDSPKSPKSFAKPDEAVPKATAMTTPEQLPKVVPEVAKPKQPLLKPVAVRKKTVDLNLLTQQQQDEQDFWGNMKTRETVAFARRKEHIERKNQMIMLKFWEQEDENTGEEAQNGSPPPNEKSKVITTKVMTSPVTVGIEMPQWPKPMEEEDVSTEVVARKAFEVTPVKLEDLKKSTAVEESPKEVPKFGLRKVQKLEESPEGSLKKMTGQEKMETKDNLKKISSADFNESQKTKDPQETATKAGFLGLKNAPVADKIKNKESTEEASKAGFVGLKKVVESKEAPIEDAPKTGFFSLKMTPAVESKEPPKESTKTEESPEESPNAGIISLKKTPVVESKEAPKEPQKTLVSKTSPKTKEPQGEAPKAGFFGLKKTPAPAAEAKDSAKEPQKTKELPEEPLKVGCFGLKKTPAVAETKEVPPTPKDSESNKLLVPAGQESPKMLINQKLSPKEMIKAIAPTIAAEAEKKMAQVQKVPKKTSPVKQEKPTAAIKQEAAPKGKQPEPQAAVEPKQSLAGAEAGVVAGAEAKKTTTKIVKKVIKVVKPKGQADAAAKAEADRLEAEQRRKAQENVEKMKAKVNQITLNMGAKLDVEIKECAKCQQASLSDKTAVLPVNKPTATAKKPSTADDKPKTEGGKLTKNKFGVVSNLSNLSVANASNQLVSNQVSTGADQQQKKKKPQQSNQVNRNRRYSSSSNEEDEEDTAASETSFSGIEDDWSSDGEEEDEDMANDKPEKKKFDPQKRVKLNIEQMRKCYSKEEKCPIVLVARPRPLWKVKRRGHGHNRKADLTSSSSGSEDESGTATDQTSSGAASTVDTSSDLNTDSSVNSSRGPKNNKKKQVKSGSKTSDVGSDIYDNPMVIPLHSEPKSSVVVSSKDENNNDSTGQLPVDGEEGENGENDKNSGNHEIRSTSTSSHDSGFYGGGTAPISPKKAMETSYTYAQFQKTGKLTAPATVIPRFRKYNVDDFHFLTVLGKGSFGKVFLAELRNTEYYYAVKCLKKDVVLEDDDVDCTLIERKVLALGTKHPFLCHLFCTFQTDSHLFFVMEYLNGGDLMFHIQQSGRFQEARARFYAAEIVSGLKFLHRKGIVYRDLKLDNVLLDYDGHVRIADFGMCKLEIYLDRLADSFCGTPDYMAPEIIKGQKYNQAVDWWSFGVLVYEMLVGQSPFSGCDEDELFWSICNEIPWFPHFLSKDALKLLQSLLEKDATIRLGCFNTMDEDSDLKYHPFFESIDWQKLERRGLEPPFKPQVRHPLDTQYFDKQFTRERARLTPIDRNILASMNQGQFEGFTYTNPNNTLTTSEITYHPIRIASRSLHVYRRPRYY